MEAERRRPAAEDEEAALEESVITDVRAGDAGDGIAYVALGSNLGDRAGSLADAVAQLEIRVAVRRVSAVYDSQAHTLPGQSAQPPFLNAVVALAPAVPARVLLGVLLDVEAGLGRRRDGERWAARTIDLDLLLFGDQVIREEGLVVPHPRLAGRRFVLTPLAELAPALVVPGMGRSVAELLAACSDPGPVERTGIVLPQP